MDLKCQKCSCKFNSKTRRPLMTPCCKDNICEQCATVIHQNFGVIKCPFCEKQIALQAVIFDEELMNYIDMLLQNTITCEEHNERQAIFFCKVHQSVVCEECANRYHGNEYEHNQDIRNEQKFQEYCQEVVNQLKKAQLKIAENISKMQQLIDKEISLDGKEFQDIIRTSTKFISQNQKSHIELQRLSFLNLDQDIQKQDDTLDQQEKGQSHGSYNKSNSVKLQSSQSLNKPIINPVLNQKQELSIALERQIKAMETLGKSSQQVQQQNKVEKINPYPQIDQQIDSCLLNPEQDLKIIHEWLDNPGKLKLQLIFRGTVNGFRSQDFHAKCDGVGPTLCVIQSNKDLIFGGYTTVSWQNCFPKESHSDPKAFLFSITKQKKFPIKNSSQIAVRHDQTYSIAFGLNDLYLSTDCNTKQACVAVLGQSFSVGDLVANYETKRTFLAGAQQFSVKEIEVFKVIIN